MESGIQLNHDLVLNVVISETFYFEVVEVESVVVLSIKVSDVWNYAEIHFLIGSLGDEIITRVYGAYLPDYALLNKLLT